jgi:two-component system OmpR family response regulator
VRRELRSSDGLAVGLSNGEFHLLRALAERPRRVLSRDVLLDLARGEHTEQFDRSIDVQISRLRRKLSEGRGGDPIRTIRGEGYMFDAEVVRR